MLPAAPDAVMARMEQHAGRWGRAAHAYREAFADPDAYRLDGVLDLTTSGVPVDFPPGSE